jgi:hypothetical protein
MQSQSALKRRAYEIERHSNDHFLSPRCHRHTPWTLVHLDLCYDSRTYPARTDRPNSSIWRQHSPNAATAIQQGKCVGETPPDIGQQACAQDC